MKSFALRLFTLFVLCSLTLVGKAEEDTISTDTSMKKEARMLVNLLGYIGKDYAMAVEDGTVINEFEYKEMKEFSKKTASYYQELQKAGKLSSSASADRLFRSLEKTIQAKGARDSVLRITKALQKHVLKAGILRMTPDHWPDQQRGQRIFVQNCSSCHGKDGGGDGPASEGLEPAPTNFLSADVMQHFSPFQAFNTTRLGIEGTSMRAFDELSDEEVWSVAFYINSLRYRKAHEDSLKGDKGPVALEDAATMTDPELKEQYGDRKGFDIASVRAYQPKAGEEDKKAPIAVAHDHLDKALALYKEGKKKAAGNVALEAYLNGVEPIEQKVRASKPSLVGALEDKMMGVRSSIRKDASVGEVEKAIVEARGVLDDAARLLDEQEYSFWFSGVLAGSIFLREGLEALLVIVAILGVLRSVNARKARRWVHGGWIVAVLVGVMSWFFTDMLIDMGIKNRELMEGAGAMIAVVMLLYIGFWLHRKTEAQRWKAFIEDRIHKLLNKNSMIGLAAIAFVVVFREAFETVLFLSSLKLEVAAEGEAGIWAGSGIAVVLLFFMAWGILRYSQRLPVRKLFLYSSVAMALLAIVLAGKGAHSLQESGLIGITSVPFDLRLSILGIYPTMESLLFQVGALLMVVLLWRISNIKPSPKISEKSEEQVAASSES